MDESEQRPTRDAVRSAAAPYLCRDHAASARSGLTLSWVAPATLECWLSAGGGALSPLGRPGGPSAKRLTGAVPALSDSACARAPSLISVHEPAGRRVGDMMVDGVTPLGSAVRPLGLSGLSTPDRRWQQEQVGSRSRCI